MKVIDYSNTIIYKLVPKDLNLNLIYIGSTTNFRTRKNRHKFNCNCKTNKAYNFKIYQMIRENGGWSAWDMIEIEKYPCSDSNECRKRERELMEQFNANLNTRKAYVSLEELKQYEIEYRITHQNEIKQYRATRKDITRDYNAKYRIDNKEILKAKRQQKIASLNLEN